MAPADPRRGGHIQEANWVLCDRGARPPLIKTGKRVSQAGIVRSLPDELLVERLGPRVATLFFLQPRQLETCSHILVVEAHHIGEMVNPIVSCQDLLEYGRDGCPF